MRQRGTRGQRMWVLPILLLLCVPLPAMGQDAGDELPDLEWPLVIEADRGDIVIYQPQLDTMTQIELQARAAVSVTPTGKSEPQFGAIWFSSRIETDFDERIVEFTDIEVTAAKFPTFEDSDVEQLKNIVESEIPLYDLTMSLDRFLASLDAVESRPVADLKHDAPQIIYSQEPSLLILIDGEPILTGIEGSDLEYVVNTPFLIVKEKKDYYLKGGEQWWKSKDVMGPWAGIDKPSKAVAELAEQMVEPEPEVDPEYVEEEAGELVVPTVYVSTGSAELIESAGPPDWMPVNDTNLLFMTNTESDVFMSLEAQEYHTLLSGRWYASSSLSEGPWAHVLPEELPDDFAKIPPDSTFDHIMASVPGTVQAQEAVLESEIPQTAEVSRSEAKLAVEYDGEPQFEPVEDTEMQYAVNTPQAVFLVDGLYYCCDEAIWFEAGSATGPWAVCDDVPDIIYTIPPSSPHYNVKYVYVYQTTPEVVYVGYTAGYVGSYHYGGCMVYGTGWVYPYWWHTMYYPRWRTWGFHVRWNPWTGWGFGFTFGRGGWFRVGFGRSPWWGPRGFHHGYRRGFHHGYRAGSRAGFRAGYAAGQRSSRNRNVYNRNRNGVQTRDRQTTADARVRDPNRGAGGDRSRDPATRDRSSDRAGQGGDRAQTDRQRPKNDVYTDRDGNVFRKGEDGSWQQRDKDGWSSSDRSGSDRSGSDRSGSDRSGSDRSSVDRSGSDRSGDRSQSGGSRTQQDRSSQQDRNRQSLNRESQQRQRGQERSRSYNNSRSSQRSRSGAARGGGGRRGGRG